MRPEVREEPSTPAGVTPQPWVRLRAAETRPRSMLMHFHRTSSSRSGGAGLPLTLRGLPRSAESMEYGAIDELPGEDAPRQAKRYAVGVVTATALVALGATSAIRTTTSLRATAQNPTGRRVQVHAFADAL